MTERTPAQLIEERCWTRIGVNGDGSCPELPRVGHCRNCEVYASAGSTLFDRPAPPDYVDLWTSVLAEDRAPAAAAYASFLVFRVGHAWLALRATSLREVMPASVVRSVPHRPRDILLGLANVRGELYPCISLHSLFSEEASASMPRTARFLVARHGSHDWVFPVDQVDGMHDVADSAIEPLPATLEHVSVTYAQQLFHAGDRAVAIVDEELLFSSLLRSVA